MPIISPANLPIEEYHQGPPEWLSKTSINKFLENGPAYWHQAYIAKSVTVPTPGGAEQGSMLDCHETEGVEAFAARYVIAPPGLDRRTSTGKAWAAENAGKEIITSSDYAILQDAVKALHALPQWPEIAACLPQMTVRRKSEALGLGLQSRPDWLAPTMTTLFDLKKTRDLREFPKQAINLGYHVQAAIAGWCLAGEGIALEHAHLVAVEWEHGARARVYEIPHEVLSAADALMRDTAAEIARRIKENDWMDHPPAQAEPLPVPDWMLRRMGAA